MKNDWVLGLVVFLVFGFVLVGCDNDTTTDDDFTGTWISDGVGETPALKMVASNGSFKHYLTVSDKEVIQGNYTISSNNVQCTVTRINTVVFGGSDEWSTWADLSTTYQAYMGGQMFFNLLL
ncbi:MAG: hypothetical protein LBI03_03355 [Clostridiales bacterium]|nr:hypothetical protein [Clostridiales bacterium]